MINTSQRELSLTIDDIGRALSEWTIERHLELDPSLSGRYGPAWRRQWVTDVRNRLQHLAQAVAVESPDVFAEHVRWSRAAFLAREVSEEDLRTSLRCMRDVIDDQVPSVAAAMSMSYIDHALSSTERAMPSSAPRVDRSSPRGDVILRYLEAALSGRRPDAERLILDLAENGTPVPAIYVEVLQPAMIEVGTMWHANELSVADEHLATATTEVVMSRLRAHYPPVPPKPRRVLSTSVSGDLHSLPVRMVADFFEMDGWSSVCLGANTPASDIAEAAAVHEPDVIAISTMSFLQLREVADTVAMLDHVAGSDGVRVIVGGLPFNVIPDLWPRIGAAGSAPTAQEAVALANRLLDTE